MTAPTFSLAEYQPSHMSRALFDELRAYIEHGRELGPFLYAALCKEYLEASQLKGEVTNAAWMELDELLWRHFRRAYGRADVVDAWIAHRGLEGI